MKPASFKYHRAGTVDEATDMLSTLDNARPLAGGQSLMPMMNLRYAAPEHVVDLNPIFALSGIDINAGRVTIGAMTRQRALLESDDLAKICPIIAAALGHVGHIQTRNRGTIGGSLAHLDPAAELPGMMALLDAEITVTGKDETRHIAMADFPLGYMTPNIEAHEILTGAAFDAWPEGHGWDFQEIAQRHGDFAMVGVGSLLTLDDGGCIDRAAVVLIGVDDAPRRLGHVEDLILGEGAERALFAEAGATAAADPMAEDALVSEKYRQHLAGVLVRRSLGVAAARAMEARDDR